MTTHKAPGRGQLKAELGRVPKEQVTKPSTAGAKTGLEVVKEKFQATVDHQPVDRIVVWDHDANQVLFSGTPKQYDRLQRAIQGGK